MGGHNGMMGQLWMLLLFAVASMAISQTGTLSEKRGLTEISAVKHVGNRRLYNEKGKGKGGKGKGKGGNGKGKGGKGKGKDGKGKGKGGKGGKGSTDDDGSDVTTLGSFRCTERGTTDSPRYPWCPEDNEKNCAAIAQGLAAGGDETETYLVDFALEIDGDVTTTLARVEAFLQEHVATDLAGCGHYSFYTGKADIQSVTFEVVEDSESAPYCDTCTNADVTTDISYNGEDPSLLESALLSAFLERCDEISDVEGVVNTYDPCSSIHVTKVDAGGEEDDQMHDDDEDVDEEESTDDDNKTDAEEVEEEDGTNGTDGEVDGSDGDAAGDETDGNEADNIGDTSGLDGTDGDAAASPTGVTQASNERGIESGGKVGIALAGLLVLLLLLLFCFRRKRKADMLKHKQLEQYDGDKTFISGSNNGSPNRGEYKDDDSFMDSRYGMYPEGQSEGMVLGAKSINQDVHKCSSATCKLCEARRQGGLQFLPITGPVKVSNFTHSVREYDTDDTVNL